MTTKAVKFITAHDGYTIGDVATFDTAVSNALIAGLLARDASENDNNFTTDLQGQINAANAARIALVASMSVEFADDAAAATGGVAIGGLYRTVSAVKVRVA